MALTFTSSFFLFKFYSFFFSFDALLCPFVCNCDGRGAGGCLMYFLIWKNRSTTPHYTVSQPANTSILFPSFFPFSETSTTALLIWIWRLDTTRGGEVSVYLQWDGRREADVKKGLSIKESWRASGGNLASNEREKRGKKIIRRQTQI